LRRNPRGSGYERRMTDLVVTLLGEDRPGLVERVAQPIAAHGGNWLESRMAHLAGQFAGILRVEVPEGSAPALVEALRRLRAEGLEVLVAPSPASAPVPARQLLELDLVGTDRPGIVREIARALAEEQVNIEELVTDRSAAAMSGELLFRARARVLVPAGADLGQLRARLERVASDLMVEVKLAPPAATPT
jgi:glycine cleavage system regulatory protein